MALLADLVSGEKLWLKADETTRHLFENAACERFTDQSKNGPKSMNYYSVPEVALESDLLTAPWARLAPEAALRSR